MIINFIQDEATPHNNDFIRKLQEIDSINLHPYYAKENSCIYNWRTNITHQVKHAKIYGDKKINLKFIWTALKSKKEKFFMVGWSNPTTRTLFILFCLTRRPFNMWFDFPAAKKNRSFLKKITRNLFYFLLKHANVTIFCVGKATIKYFQEQGFSSKKLVNLPILVDASKTKDTYINKQNEIYKKYHIGKNNFFITAGSRLIYEKGYDLLIDAISKTPTKIKNKLKVLIVGKGPEKESLTNLIEHKTLENVIYLEDWLDPEDFKACIANSDVFIHPARFDAYGGGTLYALSLGIPVIGTYSAGAAVDRINNKENGWLYKAEDVKYLSALLEELTQNNSSSKQKGINARKMSIELTTNIINIFLKNIK